MPSSCLWRCMYMFYTKLMCCAKNFKRQKLTLPLFTEISERLFMEFDHLCFWRHIRSFKPCYYHINVQYKSGTIIFEFLVQFYLILIGYKTDIKAYLLGKKLWVLWLINSTVNVNYRSQSGYISGRIMQARQQFAGVLAGCVLKPSI